jgi:hypothetical protein
MNLRFKLHEWAADRFSFVQYPHTRQIHHAKTQSKLSRVDRGLMILIGLGLGLAGFAAVCVGTFVLYVVVSAF